MSNRTIRVNELIQRELNDILHRRFQSEAVAVTITEVRVAPDLRDAMLFISIIGNDDFVQKKLRWFKATLPALSQELGRRIVLKFMPRFNVKLDKSTVRGNRILAALDELAPSTSDEHEPNDPAKSEEKE